MAEEAAEPGGSILPEEDLFAKKPKPKAPGPGIKPWVAGLLSGLVPGLGQAFNGKWLKACVLPLLYPASHFYTISKQLSLVPPNRWIDYTVTVILLGFYFWQIVDAYSHRYAMATVRPHRTGPGLVPTILFTIGVVLAAGAYQRYAIVAARQMVAQRLALMAPALQNQTKARLQGLRNALNAYYQDTKAWPLDLRTLFSARRLDKTPYIDFDPIVQIGLMDHLDTREETAKREDTGKWYYNPWTHEVRVDCSHPDVSGVPTSTW